MKVLHVLSRLKRSGAERMLECSSDLWANAGFETIIVGMADGEHPYTPALEARGYRVIELPGVRSVRGIDAFRRTVHQVRPEVVHIHQEGCHDVVALISTLSSSVKAVVQTVHSSFQFSGNLRVRRKARVAFSQRLGVVWVSCAQQVAENECFRYGNPTLVVENWVDTAALIAASTEQTRRQTRDVLGVAPDAVVLGLIGNCDEPKNHELIPSALREVLRPVHLLHVGDRSEMPQVETDNWPHLPTRHTVHHLGSRDDIPELLAACDVLLMPSRREGLPLVPIEALCAGVPVLASDVVTLQWLRSFPATVLAPPSPDEWGRAIEAVLTRDWTAELKVSTEASRVRFSPCRGVSEYTAVYDLALGFRRRGHRFPYSDQPDVTIARPD